MTITNLQVFPLDEEYPTKYTSYKEIEKKLKQKRAFKGNSAEGYTVYGFYIIKSYETKIFIGAAQKALFNIEKYSPTTSKIQNLIRKHLLKKYETIIKCKTENELNELEMKLKKIPNRTHKQKHTNR